MFDMTKTLYVFAESRQIECKSFTEPPAFEPETFKEPSED